MGVRVEPNSVIYGPARIGRDAFVGPLSTVGFPVKDVLKAHRRTRTPLLSNAGSVPVELGRDCVVRSGCAIYATAKLGDYVQLGHNVMIRENVSIGDRSLVGTNTIIDGSCRIGKHVSLQSGVYIPTNSVVEDFAFLGPYCVLTNDKYVMQKPTNLMGPKIRKGASIGANAVIFPEVTIGEGAVVGAGSVVNHDVPAHTVVAGVPARELKKTPEDWRSLLWER